MFYFRGIERSCRQKVAKYLNIFSTPIALKLIDQLVFSTRGTGKNRCLNATKSRAKTMRNASLANLLQSVWYDRVERVQTMWRTLRYGDRHDRVRLLGAIGVRF